MMDEKDTKERILDTAECLFAEKGIKETSVREITSAAEAHLAAVNYHFGSKEGLIRAVLTRRTEPLNKERLRILETFEVEAGSTPVPLESILHALFTPPIKLCLKHPDFMRLAGRMLSEPDKELRRVFVSQFEEVFLRFKTALGRTLPDLPEKELLWRMHFIAGAMIHTYTNYAVLESLSSGLCILTDDEEVVERLISFCVAGLRTPLPAKIGKTS
ncbi:MAG: TetR/AcrR family transcriptional regulator [Deltaproteobacteria bacterium]|nr:TetR/AcrR family transcriptional regulator [Deltaproteobacteria bacterium]